MLDYGNGGYIAPDCIIEGGKIWEQNSSIDDMILYGKAEIPSKNDLPEGVLEVVTKKQIEAKEQESYNEALKQHKAKLYATETDSLFIEAVREKFEGREDKWNEYITKCKTIYDKTSIDEEMFL